MVTLCNVKFVYSINKIGDMFENTANVEVLPYVIFRTSSNE